ncbi:MAG TPA: hypothetical protein VNR89_14205 [Roseomonas sp.]|nr:hypothetical protein [Roseomonas sp.]
MTGRDYDIVSKALAYAITTIDNLPRRQQEGSDRDDMALLLAAMEPNRFWHDEALRTARRHMGLEPCLSPKNRLKQLNSYFGSTAKRPRRI